MGEKIVVLGGVIAFLSFAFGGATVFTPLYKYAVFGILVSFAVIVFGILVDLFAGGEK